MNRQLYERFRPKAITQRVEYFGQFMVGWQSPDAMIPLAGGKVRKLLVLTVMTWLTFSIAVLAQEKFSISIDFKTIKRCSDISPEIVVKNVPTGTSHFEVLLRDLDAPSYSHGGGKVSHDGGGAIKVGAVKGTYDGPCPPFTHTYQYFVTALDKDGKVLAKADLKGDFP